MSYTEEQLEYIKLADSHNALLKACKVLISNKKKATSLDGNLVGYNIAPVYINELKQAVLEAETV